MLRPARLMLQLTGPKSPATDAGVVAALKSGGRRRAG